jgi:hypothetical protein
LRNTQKQSESQCSYRLPSGKNSVWSFSIPISHIHTKQVKGADGYPVFTIAVSIGNFIGPSIEAISRLLRNPPPCIEEKEEAPDFTEADKEWIAKIDRTKLTLEDW